MKDWCGFLRPSAVRNMVLHRLGASGIHWRHLLPRHANVHVVGILRRRRRRRSRFDFRNHRFGGSLVPISSSRMGGRRRGRPGGFKAGILSGTVCGLLLLLLLLMLMLLLLGVLAVALVMDAFPRLALLAFGVVPLLET